MKEPRNSDYEQLTNQMEGSRVPQTVRGSMLSSEKGYERLKV